MATIPLPVLSNVFMTFASYGHLRYPHWPLWQAILISWTIAFFEYLLMVPANRWGGGQFTAVQLKTIQEIVTLSVFAGFAVPWLGETLRWNQVAAFACLVAAAFFMFGLTGRQRKKKADARDQPGIRLVARQSGTNRDVPTTRKEPE